MATALIPQEIYLLERYSSLAYFIEMHGAWQKMILTAENALDRFMKDLPSNYRKQHLSMQPDIVWGEKVLPNFRSTMEALSECLIKMQNNDLTGMGIAGGIRTACIGQNADYPPEWMTSNEEEEFEHWKDIARNRAGNIEPTVVAQWNKGELGNSYDVPARGPLLAPPSWPQYKLDPSVRAKSGEPLKHTGIYLPDCDDSNAQLLVIDQDFPEAADASIGYDEQRMQNVSTAPTTWTLVRRIADSGGGIPGDSDPMKAGIRLRFAAGEACNLSGFYFTPAQSNSRRKFDAGQIMPELNSQYGATIWQWDEQQ
jgi:hypothetical protein